MIHIAPPSKRLSRRRFMRCGASLATLPALARAEGLPPQAPAKPQAGQPDAQKIAAETDAEDHLTVDVMLNGMGPFQFVVDTGADRTVMADNVAKALGVAKGNGVNVQGIIRTVPTDAAPVRMLTVGAVSRENIRIPVLPRVLLRSDGYLGLDVIDGYEVTFDFRAHNLEVRETRVSYLPTLYRNRDEDIVPVYGSSGHLRSVDCRADNIYATAFIDTGAEVSVGNPSLYAALLEDNPLYVTKTTIPITGVTGGQIPGQVVGLHHVRLHSFSFNRCVIAIAPLPIFDLWGLSERPALLIGMDWLRQFARVSIDYRNKELKFDFASLQLVARA